MNCAEDRQMKARGVRRELNRRPNPVRSVRVQGLILGCLLLLFLPTARAQQGSTTATVHLKNGLIQQVQIRAVNNNGIQWTGRNTPNPKVLPHSEIARIDFPEPDLWKQGNRFFYAGDYPKAIAAFSGLAKNPAGNFYPAPGNYTSRAQLRLIDCFRETGNTKGIAEVAAALKAESLPPTLRGQMDVIACWAELSQGNWNAAIAKADALEANPILPAREDLGYIKAVALENTGRTQEAITAYGAAYTVDFGGSRELAKRSIKSAIELLLASNDEGRAGELLSLVHTYAKVYNEGELWEGAPAKAVELLNKELEGTGNEAANTEEETRNPENTEPSEAEPKTAPAATDATEVKVPETGAKQANDPPRQPTAPAATHAAALKMPEQHDDGLKVADISSVKSDKQALRQLVVKLRGGEFGEVCSLLIAKGDTLLIEEYFRDAGIDKLHPTRSHTKSVTSYAVGKAIEQGDIKSIDDPILDYLPEVDATKVLPGIEKLTIKDCLTMSAGLRGSKENKQPKGLKKDAVVPWILEDWTNELVTAERKFSYSYSDPMIISHVLFNATGHTIEEMAVKHFFKPMGINKYKFRTLGTGLTNPIDNMELRSRDILKLGLLTLNGGVWDGKQLLNKAYIDEATTAHATVNEKESYGYFWWVNRINVKGKSCEVKTAFGAGGQMIYVVPEFDMVVVFTAENADKRKLLALLQDTIVPALNR